MAADETSLRFSIPDASGVDVLFDGRRVWSFAPSKARLEPDGGRVVAWPDPIRRRLDGRATIALRDPQTRTVLAEADVSFGSGEGEVSLVDSAGRPLALHKWGRLQQPFEAMPSDDIQAYLDFVDQLMGVLRDECGVEPFLSFGALLGAVRSGALIGHDVDVDIGYFSEHRYPVDVIRETFRVERALRAHGWRVVLDNAMFIQVFAPSVGGVPRNVDIFTCFAGADGLLYQANDITADGDRSAVVPTSVVEVEGRTFPAPRDVERFLVAAYGPSWRVPDPTFSYGFNYERRRIRGWTGGLREERARWREYYASGGGRERPAESAFARSVLSRLSELGVDEVVDVGCGLGSDTLFFADQGFGALGLDAVPSVIRNDQSAARAVGSDAQFGVVNLASTRSVLSVGARVARHPGRRAVFARHVVDELTEGSREGFWRFCSMVLRGGGRSYLEFTPGVGRGRSRPFSDRDPYPASRRSVRRDAGRFGAVELDSSTTASTAPGPSGRETCRMTLEWP